MAADSIRNHFQSPRFLHAAAGRSIEVVYFDELNPRANSFELAWDAPCPVAIVVLLDRQVADNPKWVEYVRVIGNRTGMEGFQKRMIPVSIESSVLDSVLIDQQAIRWDQWAGTAQTRSARLMRTLTYEFTKTLQQRLHQETDPNADGSDLGPYLEKIRVFLSHSKHDANGAVVANEIRNWLHSNSALASFLDVHDIPAGLTFSEVIEYQVKHSAMLVVHTDSFSSRQWCRREVVEAKRHGVPIVVADCLREGEERLFPYLGNVPVVRMNPNSPNRIPRVISRLLDELLVDMLWKNQVLDFQKRDPFATFAGRPPEFASLASWGWGPDRQGNVVYPGLPIGDEEMDLIKVAWGGLELLTVSQWLATKR